MCRDVGIIMHVSKKGFLLKQHKAKGMLEINLLIKQSNPGTRIHKKAVKMKCGHRWLTGLKYNLQFL
jgi:hypothetical protein